MIKENSAMNEFPILDPRKGVPIFYPYIPKNVDREILDTLKTRWIGQGPKVDKFEKLFKKKYLNNKFEALAVGSGTDALHLAYLLAGLKKNDEVLVPVFTCTATNIPLLYIGAKIVFIDVDPETMNIDLNDLKKKITSKTKAIVCVDYGGVPNDYLELNKICKSKRIKLISDGAHSLGTKYHNKFACTFSDFTIFSFQAIKTMTTADGGMLIIKDKKLRDKAKRLRWFGINRSKKQLGTWENDIKEIGYKYQMNDVAASLGIISLKNIDSVIKKRNLLFSEYEKNIKNDKVKSIGKSKTKDYFNSCWLITILVKKGRKILMKKLRKHGIESAQVHYRNDRYSIFGGRIKLKNMDFYEDKYLVLPIHPKVSVNDVKKICSIINSKW